MAGQPSHITPANRKRRGMNAGVHLTSLQLSQDFLPWHGVPTFQMDLPTLVNTVSFTGMLSRLFPWQF